MLQLPVTIQTAPNEPDFLKKIVTLKGTKPSLSHVQCFLYLLQDKSLFFMDHSWILSGQTLCTPNGGYLGVWGVEN